MKIFQKNIHRMSQYIVFLLASFITINTYAYSFQIHNTSYSSISFSFEGDEGLYPVDMSSGIKYLLTSGHSINETLHGGSSGWLRTKIYLTDTSCEYVLHTDLSGDGYIVPQYLSDSCQRHIKYDVSQDKDFTFTIIK